MTFIQKLQEAYYQGNPLISNEEYDALTRYLEEDSIGAAGDVAHWARMYSLDKKYPCRGDALPSNLADYVETDKLDGCAVSNLYYNGSLVRSLTRGDGILGTDITEKMLRLIPSDIDNAPAGYMQVTGEVVTTAQVQNRRNFASGAMNQKDIDAFEAKVEEGGMIFVAYGAEIPGEEGIPYSTYTSLMYWLSSRGFEVVTLVNAEERGIPTDGKVFRLENMRDFEAAGYTAKFPRGAFAVKEDEQGEWTKLVDVVWATGKSGKVTPTAIFEEVVIDDARLTRATLNNKDYMSAIGLTHIGQEVCVIRAGGIIPKIIETR